MDVQGQANTIRRIKSWGWWTAAALCLATTEAILLLAWKQYNEADLSLFGLFSSAIIFSVSLLGFFWLKAKAGWPFLR